MKIVKKKTLPGRRLAISIITAIILTLSIFLYINYKNNNLFWQKNNTTDIDSTQTINDDTQTPTTPTTENKTNDTNSSNTSQKSNQSVILSAAGQDSKGGPLIVRAIITGYNETGVCKLILTKDSVVKNYSSVINLAGTYYSCDGFSVDFSELSIGNWHLVLEISQDGETSIVSQDIILENV